MSARGSAAASTAAAAASAAGLNRYAAGIWSIGDGTKAPGEWWRLETNWDHWTVITDGRRQAANKAMAGIGQDFVDLGAMEKLLATPPVLADDTVYTALIWPSGSVYQSTVRTHTAAARASVEA